MAKKKQAHDEFLVSNEAEGVLRSVQASSLALAYAQNLALKAEEPCEFYVTMRPLFGEDVNLYLVRREDDEEKLAITTYILNAVD